MRKLLYLLVMCSAVLWGCSKGDDKVENPEDPENPDNTTNVYLEVYPSELVFEAQGGKKSFQIQCYTYGSDYSYATNCEWTITGGGEWCKTDVAEGCGYEEVTVTVDAYSETQDRNTNLTIKAGEKSYVLTVTQKHGDAIVLSKDKFDVPEEGGEVTVEVKSNIQYEVSIPYQFRDWIEQAPESKAVTEKSCRFTISENKTYETREGFIVFKGNSLKDTVFIYQSQKNQLILSQNTYNLQSTGGDIVVELKTNIDYDVHILDNAASWISRISTKSIREDRLDFQIAANMEKSKRSARILIKDKNSDFSDTVYVVQAPKGTYGGNLIWETEQDVIDFHAARHTKIIGNIVIQGNEIKTLQKLDNVLTEIDGSITFDCKTLSTFDGLYGLKKISENLIIQKGSMTSFEGLENLEEIGGNFKVIGYSSSLSSLTSFSGLNNLKRIGGDLELNASSDYYPSSLDKLSSFEGLENLEEIGGNFKVIGYSYSLSSLTSFSGLSSLKRIGGKKLTIKNCTALNNIDALSKINALDEISITGCFKLYDFCVLKNVVQNMSGTFYVNENGYNPTKWQLLNGECSQATTE